MAKTKQKTINKPTPYIILVTEIITFYTGFSWLFGVWKPGYGDELSDLHLSLALCYLFGVFTFVFFVIVLPPPLLRGPFIRITLIFAVAALPSFFLSTVTALSYTLWQRISYMQSLEKGLTEVWKGSSGIFLPLALHTLGFMAALGLRKIFNTTLLKSGS